MLEPPAPAEPRGCSWWCGRCALPGVLLLATAAYSAWHESPWQVKVASVRLANAQPAMFIQDVVVSSRPTAAQRGAALFPKRAAAAPPRAHAPRMRASANEEAPPHPCRALRRPPYQIHGKFAQNGPAAASLTRAELESARLARRYPAFEAFLKKLASGAHVRIAVIGGSFTKGGNCTQVLADGRTVTKWECSWPTRFKLWMQEFFPAANVTYLNLVRSATASCAHLAVLPLTLQFHMRAGPIDLVFLETLVNGAQKVKEDFLCYEHMVRTFHRLSPHTAVFSVFAGSNVFWRQPKMWRVAVEEVHVVQHYGVPYVNFAALVRARPELWIAPGQQTPVHPMWPTHQLLADLIAEAWGSAWAQACTGPPDASDAAPGFPDRTYFNQTKLSPFTPCLHPVSSYSADQPATSYHGGVAGASPRVLAGNWTLYEDRPGKPGWISTDTSSVLSFPVAFSKQPALVVMYLRSYESLGDAVVTVQPQNNSVQLKGSWAERASQADILRLVEGAQWDLYTRNKFRLPRGGTADVRITNVGRKFKVLSVFSC